MENKDNTAVTPSSVAPPTHLTSAAAYVEAGAQDACEDACSICLESFTESEPGTATICKHEYHLQCILEWAQRSQDCPMCLGPLALQDPDSAELLMAVSRERQLLQSMGNSHPTSNMHFAPLGFDFRQYAASVGELGVDSDLERRILHHLAAAAAGMTRARGHGHGSSRRYQHQHQHQHHSRGTSGSSSGIQEAGAGTGAGGGASGQQERSLGVSGQGQGGGGGGSGSGGSNHHTHSRSMGWSPPRASPGVGTSQGPSARLAAAPGAADSPSPSLWSSESSPLGGSADAAGRAGGADGGAPSATAPLLAAAAWAQGQQMLYMEAQQNLTSISDALKSAASRSFFSLSKSARSLRERIRMRPTPPAPGSVSEASSSLLVDGLGSSSGPGDDATGRATNSRSSSSGGSSSLRTGREGEGEGEGAPHVNTDDDMAEIPGDSSALLSGGSVSGSPGEAGERLGGGLSSSPGLASPAVEVATAGVEQLTLGAEQGAARGGGLAPKDKVERVGESSCSHGEGGSRYGQSARVSPDVVSANGTLPSGDAAEAIPATSR